MHICNRDISLNISSGSPRFAIFEVGKEMGGSVAYLEVVARGAISTNSTRGMKCLRKKVLFPCSSFPVHLLTVYCYVVFKLHTALSSRVKCLV